MHLSHDRLEHHLRRAQPCRRQGRITTSLGGGGGAAIGGDFYTGAGVQGRGRYRRTGSSGHWARRRCCRSAEVEVCRGDENDSATGIFEVVEALTVALQEEVVRAGLSDNQRGGSPKCGFVKYSGGVHTKKIST